MHRTKNDLQESIRVKLVELLNDRLADSIDLMMQAKQAHWNVKGPDFIQLHELFDKAKDDLEEYVDVIAERAAQLGGTVEGTIRAVSKRSTLDEYPLDIVDGKAHVDCLSSAIAKVAKTTRQAIGRADELNDAVTADLFTEVCRGLDKLLWMVEAHLRAER